MKIDLTKMVAVLIVSVFVLYGVTQAYGNTVRFVNEKKQAEFHRMLQQRNYELAQIKAMEDGKKSIFGFICTRFKDTVNKF